MKIRTMFTKLGNALDTVLLFAKRRIQAIKDIRKGDILKEGFNFEVLRPGNRIRGLEPRFLDKINGTKSTKNVLKGDGITEFE